MHVHCPTCKYEGKAKSVTNGFLHIVVVLCLLVASAVFWPMLLVAFCAIFYFIKNGRDWICPVCKSKTLIPLNHYKHMNRTEGATS
jgi:rubredoxin